MIKEMRIETSRLIIRPYIESDLLESFELMQNKEQLKYLPMEVMSLEEYKGLFKWLIDSYENDYDGNFKYSFAIFLKEAGRLIGWCGVGDNDCNKFYHDKEINYLIGQDYWGNGYATEAMNALINYCFNTMKLERLIAFAKPENIASNRVIQKLGFKFQHLVSGLPKELDFYNGEPYYLLTKEEYLEMISLGKAASNNIFTIDCKDVMLREFRLEDLDELYNLTLQPEITDYLPDWKATKEQRKEWLINMHMKSNKEFLEVAPNIGDQWLNLGIILKKTNEFIGWCCTGPSDELPKPNREIGYAISKYHRNKSYTTQAVKALIEYLFKKTNVEVLNAMALTHNSSSNRVIQKCGFNYINNIKIGNREFYHYKLSKNE